SCCGNRSKTRGVIAGLVPVISIRMAKCPIMRMGGTSPAMTKWAATSCLLTCCRELDVSEFGPRVTSDQVPTDAEAGRDAAANARNGCPWHDVQTLLREVGLRPTRQRMALGWLLFAKGDRHLTAEMLYEEASRAKIAVSLATVYNTLHQFTSAGLLR